jgi:hypothetical protein
MSHLYLDHRRILLIGENARQLNLRAAVFRNHEIEVHTASTLSHASLWKTIPYDLVLLATPEDCAEGAQITAQIRESKPRQRIALLVGPPAYIKEVGRPARKPQRVTRDSHQPTVAPDGERVASPQWQLMVQKVVSGWYSQQRSLLGLSKSGAS